MKISIKIISILFLAASIFQGCATTKELKAPEVMFKEGEEYFQKGHYGKAITEWKKVKESYHSPELTTKAELGIADAYFLNKDYIESAASYEDFQKLHPAHPKSGYALFRQAISYYKQIHGIDTDQTPVRSARSTFESYSKMYPKGEHIAETKDKINDCRDKQLQYETYVGRFYLKNDKYTAAITRFEEALKTFPDLPSRDETFFYLGKAYRESGQKPKGQEVYERLLREYPNSGFAANVKKELGKQ